jgi:hypothetical protein
MKCWRSKRAERGEERLMEVKDLKKGPFCREARKSKLESFVKSFETVPNDVSLRVPDIPQQIAMVSENWAPLFLLF